MLLTNKAKFLFWCSWFEKSNGCRHRDTVARDERWRSLQNRIWFTNFSISKLRQSSRWLNAFSLIETKQKSSLYYVNKNSKYVPLGKYLKWFLPKEVTWTLTNLNNSKAYIGVTVWKNNLACKPMTKYRFVSYYFWGCRLICEAWPGVLVDV